MDKSKKQSIKTKENIDVNIFKLLFEHSISGILYGNPEDGNIYDANQAATDMFGYTIDELNKLNRNDIFDFNHHSMINSLKIRSENGSAKGELIGIRKNGERFPCEFASSIFKNINGEVRTCTILNDISERKKAEGEMALLLDNTEESFVLIDSSLKIVSFNKVFARQYQYLLNKEVKKGDSIVDYSISGRETSIVNVYKEVLAGQIIKDIGEFVDRNGDIHYYTIVYKPAKTCKGEIIGIFLTARDTTAKMLAVKQSDSEQRNREALINNTDDLIWSINSDLSLITANNAFTTFIKNSTGVKIKPGDVAVIDNKTTREYAKFWNKLYKIALKGKSFKYEAYTPGIGKVSSVWYEIHVNPIYNNEEVVGVACYGRNITEKKNIELKLKENNDIFEKLTSKIPAALYQFEINKEGKMYFPYISSGIKFINPNVDVNLLKTDATSAFATVHPEDLNGLLKSIEVSKNNLTDWEYEYRSILDNNIIVWTQGKSSPEKKPDGTISWYGYLQDITEQKNTNEKIRESKERYDIIAKATNDTIWDWDLKTNQVKWNKGIAGIYGYEICETEMNLDWWFSKIHPLDLIRVRKKIELRISTQVDRWEEEYRFLCFDETYKYVHDRGFLVVENSVPVRMIGAMQDITEQKNNQDKIKTAIERYDIIAKATNDTIWDIDLMSNSIKWNDGIKTVFGYSEDEPNIYDANWWYTKIHPDDINYIREKSNNWLSSKEIRCEFEYRFMCYDGTYKYVHDRGFLVIENSVPVRMIGAMQDITERKQSEEKLRASVQQFKTIFEGVPACVKLMGLNGDLLEINKAGLKMLEAETLHQAKSQPLINYLLPKYHEPFLDIHNRTIADENCSLEFEMLGLKGTKRWVETHTVPMKDSNNQIIKVLAITQDVSHYKANEKALQESEIRYRTMIECSPEPIAVHSQGKIVFVNPTAVKLFGASSLNDLIGKSIFDIIHPDFHEISKTRISNTLKGIPNNLKDDYKLLMMDGTVKDIISEGTSIIYDGKPSIHIVMKDITKQKQEEHHLKLLESVIINTLDAVIITDSGLNDEIGPKIIFVNHAFSVMTGYSFDEVIGKSPRFLRGPKSDLKELKRLKEAIKKQESCEITSVNYKKNGEEFWIDLSVSPVFDHQNNLTHWISVERDVTQKKHDEIERELIIAELSQNNKDLKQFSHVISHNLRAPIANLLGLTSLIDHYKVTSKTLKQILDGIKQSALMFDDTIKDLTKVLVIKDQTNIIKKNVVFVEVIDKVLKQLSISINDNAIKINYEFKNAPCISFSESYAESILLNLFTNAIRYQSPKRKLKIDIVSAQVGDFIELKFSDNGIGIDTERYKEKLFKLYQRFHDNPDGKGLGLYLIKSQIEALGGSINIESKVGKGTTFILKFKNSL